jgi:hypothetical protein
MLSVGKDPLVKKKVFSKVCISTHLQLGSCVSGASLMV